jgi:hypothetical protein
MKSIIRKFLAGVVLASTASLVSAAVIAVDQFDYTGNNTLGGDGATNTTGWSGNWYDAGAGNFWTLAGGSLDSTGTQAITPTAGNRVISSGARSYRNFATSYSDATTQTLYMSYLVDSTTADAYKTFELFSGGTADGNRTFQLGALSGDSGAFGNSVVTARANQDGTTVQSLGARAAGVEFFLVEFDLDNGGNDTISIWRNPGATLGTADATISVASIAFDRVGLASFGTGDITFDEFRFGTTLADVTTSVIPEPSTFALVGIALGAAFFIRRRK